APFAAYLDAGDFQVVSASPERFVALSGSRVSSSPIKGTRPRGPTPEEDLRLSRELSQSAKDRAENVMIADLVRNDLGRVCETGSVRVERLCALESFATVHHLVSSVSGNLRPDADRMDLNIVIRTLVCASGLAHLRVGGAVVADSRPEQEHRETLDKARALLDALGARLVDA